VGLRPLPRGARCPACPRGEQDPERGGAGPGWGAAGRGSPARRRSMPESLRANRCSGARGDEPDPQDSLGRQTLPERFPTGCWDHKESHQLRLRCVYKGQRPSWIHHVTARLEPPFPVCFSFQTTAKPRSNTAESSALPEPQSGSTLPRASVYSTIALRPSRHGSKNSRSARAPSLTRDRPKTISVGTAKDPGNTALAALLLTKFLRSQRTFSELTAHVLLSR